MYGCLRGSSRLVLLWDVQLEQTGSLQQVAGRFVAVRTTLSNQYTFDEAVSVFDLRNGATYSIASLTAPLGGMSEGHPATLGPWPLERFVLGADGRSVRLYDTFAASVMPTGEVLDVIGYHRFRRRLATSASGAIMPTSLAYHGHTVTWTQDRSPRSATI